MGDEDIVRFSSRRRSGMDSTIGTLSKDAALGFQVGLI